MKYTFLVEDEGEVVFRSETESLVRIEEEIGRYERNIKEGFRPVGKSVWLK
jgi:hypothetical protein